MAAPARFNTRSGTRWTAILSGLLVLLWGVASVRAATVEVSLSQSYVIEGRAITMSLNFINGSPQGSPALPQIPGARVQLAGRGSNWQSDGLQATLVTTFYYAVTPTTGDDITIPAMRFLVDGQYVESEPVTLEVVSQSEARDAQARAAEQAAKAMEEVAFVRVELPKQQVYVGERILAQIKIYSRAGAHNIQLHQFKAEDFTLDQGGGGPQSREEHDGKAYLVTSLVMPIAARRAGDLPVGPAEVTMEVVVPPQFRADFGALRAMRLRSNQETLEVLPLPPNPPAHFTGAVGRFSMEVEASTTNLVVGDPLTLRVAIQARGTVDDLRLPEQTGWREFKTYDVDGRVVSRDPMGLSGLKVFERLVAPVNAEVKQLPPFYFSYFDPEARDYKTLSSPAVPLQVAASTAPNAQPTYLGGEEREPESQSTLRHIKPRFGQVETGGLLLQRPWFWLVQLVPLFTWLSVVAWKRREANLARNPRKLRERQVASLVASGRAELKFHAQEGNGGAFYETAMRLLREQIGERLDVPAISITEEIIDEGLTARGLSPTDAARLHQLFQTFNRARYAGGGSAGELTALLPGIDDALRSIQRLPAA